MLRLAAEAIIAEPVVPDVEVGARPAPAEWTTPWPQTPWEFERLIEAFQDRLIRYAYRRVNCIVEAEDVAQEVFVKAFTHRRELIGVVRVAPYLYRMTANLCTDRQRRRQPLMVSMDDVNCEQVQDSSPSARTRAAAAQELKRVSAVLDHIPERQAEVVRLMVLDDLSAAEAAEVLGSSVATIKSRLRYGLLKLRRVIGRKENRS